MNIDEQSNNSPNGKKHHLSITRLTGAIVLAFVCAIIFFNGSVARSFYLQTGLALVVIFILTVAISKTRLRPQQSAKFRPVDPLILFSFFGGLFLLPYSSIIDGDGSNTAAYATLALFILFLCSLIYGFTMGIIEMIQLYTQGETTRSFTVFFLSVLIPGVFLLICLASWFAIRYWA